MSKDARQLKEWKLHIQAEMLIGSNYIRKKEYKEGQYYLEETLEKAKKKLHSKNDIYIILYNWLGYAHRLIGDYDRTLELYQTILDRLPLIESIDFFKIKNLYNSIGIIYEYKGNNKKAIEYYKLALKRLFRNK